jgi:hypothetical protein
VTSGAKPVTAHQRTIRAEIAHGGESCEEDRAGVRQRAEGAFGRGMLELLERILTFRVDREVCVGIDQAGQNRVSTQIHEACASRHCDVAADVDDDPVLHHDRPGVELSSGIGVDEMARAYHGDALRAYGSGAAEREHETADEHARFHRFPRRADRRPSLDDKPGARYCARGRSSTSGLESDRVPACGALLRPW